MTSQYHYGIYSQNRAAERHILHKPFSSFTRQNLENGRRYVQSYY